MHRNKEAILEDLAKRYFEDASDQWHGKLHDNGLKGNDKGMHRLCVKP